MSRSARVLSESGIYHVMIRGINKQCLFEDTEDYSKFLYCILDLKSNTDFILYAYCLMGNHVHLLIKEGREPLSQVIKRIGIRYVFWFNSKYERFGHLFQDRFKSEPIDSDEYFLTVLAYIYQNPKNAGLCKHAQDYEWCSLKYLGRSKIVDEAELFEVFPLYMIEDKVNEIVDSNLLEIEAETIKPISDDSVLEQIKVLGGVRSVTDFQLLDRDTQAKIIYELHQKGASLRQVARLSGMGRRLVTRLCSIGYFI